MPTTAAAPAAKKPNVAPTKKSAPVKSAAPAKTAPAKAAAKPAPAEKPVKPAKPAKALPPIEAPGEVTVSPERAAKAAKPSAPSKVRFKEIAEITAARLPVGKATIDRVLAEFVMIVQEQYQIGSVIDLKGLGKLQIQDRPARTGRNPSTGEPVQVPAKRVPKFRFAKDLKDLV